MKSKAHHKKCVELGIIPVPTSIDDSQIDSDALAKQEQLERTYSGGNLMSEDEDESEDGEEYDESDDEGVPIPLTASGQLYSSYLAATRGGGQLSPEKPTRKVSFINNSMESHHNNFSMTESSKTLEPKCMTGDDSTRRTSVIVNNNKNEEEEVAQSLLSLSGSWTGSQQKQPKVGDAVIPAVTLSPPEASPSSEMKNKSCLGGRKVSILESTLTSSSSSTALALNGVNPYFSRPRSFSFNDVPARASILFGGQTDRNNNHNHKSKSTVEPPLMTCLKKRILMNLQNESVQQKQIQEQNKSQEMETLEQPEEQVHKINGETSNGLSADLKQQNNDEEDEEEMIDVGEEEMMSIEKDSSSSTASNIETVTRNEKQESCITTAFPDEDFPEEEDEELDDDEDEPMDLSKKSTSCVNDDKSDENEEMMSDSIERVMTGRQDFDPIPLASGGEGKCICTICNKIFSKPSQLRLHVNIHYFERPFRCEACAVSFRTKGHLQKHKRSTSHYNKINMNKTFGTPSNENPRPFKCSDCKVAFRIHGHLAKHLRSKLHIMKLECLNKLPFGMFAEMERSGVDLNEIDTTDCQHSLTSLQAISKRMAALPGSTLDISNMISKCNPSPDSLCKPLE